MEEKGAMMVEQAYNKPSSQRLFSRGIGGFMVKISAWIVGIVFVYSALHKIYAPYSFLAIIYGYELVTPFQGLLIAHMLPWIELTLGMLLISQSFLRTTWFLVTIMLTVFVVVRLMVIVSGLSVPCGCYGNNDDVINWQNTSITIALLIVSAISFFQSRGLHPCPANVRCPENS